MSITPSEYIQGETFAPPYASLPPIDVTFEVAAGALSPSEVQLRRLASICAEFPRLWRVAMDGLQQRFDEEGDDRRAIDAVLSAGVYMPTVDEVETDTDFYWSLELEIRDRQPWQGWEADFHGHQFIRITFYP